MTLFSKLPSPSDYVQTLSLMENRVKQVIDKEASEIIYLVEHNDVYTTGANFGDNDLLHAGDIPVIYTNRGGKFTYHGLGQRVIYPILDLSQENRYKDIKLYIRNLEKWIINSLAHFDIHGYVIPNRVGIWVKEGNTEAKIAAIGVRIKKWVTFHGIAVNISTNLDKYSGIIPCGDTDFPVTSMLNLGVKINLSEFDNIVEQEFSRVF